MKRLLNVLTVVIISALCAAIPAKASQGTTNSPRVAFTSANAATTIQRIYGPLHYGADFGLQMTLDNFTIFTDSSTATQAVLSGQGDIIGGSFVSTLLVRQAGEDFKVFCPNGGRSDSVIVGRNGIKSLDQLFDAKTRVGVDSPGGSGDAALNAILQANKVSKTTSDIPNKTELASSSLRSTAFSSDKVDVTILQLNQFRQLEKDVPDSVIIATLYDSAPNYVNTAFSAQAAWLDANQETAAAFCASVLKGGKMLSADFDLYYSAITELVSKPPKAENVRELFSMISKYDFWKLKDGITPDDVAFMGKVAVQSGQLDTLPKYEDVVDEQVYKRAIELLANDIHKTPQPK